MASPPLKKAVECYEDLDYPCAETHLTQALATRLLPDQRLKALYYQSLIAMAWRDEARARRVVQNILVLDPTFQPKDAPAQLKGIFEALRPKPEPKPIAHFRLDYAYTPVADSANDGSWWTGGHGIDGAGGVILKGKFVLDLNIRWARHLPQPTRFSVRDLTYWALGLNGGLTHRWGRFRLTGGLGLGGVRMSRNVVESYLRFKDKTAGEPYWMFALTTYIDLSVDLVYGLAIGVRWAPMVLVRSYEDQPILSYLLPLTVGVRYGR